MDHGTEDSRLKTYGMLNMICAGLRASPLSQYKAKEAPVVVNDMRRASELSTQKGELVLEATLSDDDSPIFRKGELEIANKGIHTINYQTGLNSFENSPAHR